MPRTQTTQKWSLASTSLLDAYTDFILSRQAMNCTPATLEFYKYTVRAFLSWVELQGATTPEEVTARLIRSYLAGWTSLAMVEHYAQLEDIDLLAAHKAHSPVDNAL